MAPMRASGRALSPSCEPGTGPPSGPYGMSGRAACPSRDPASYRLQATSYKLQAASYKLQAASCKLQAASCKLQATRNLQATSCNQDTAACIQDTAACCLREKSREPKATGSDTQRAKRRNLHTTLSCMLVYLAIHHALEGAGPCRK